MIWAGGMPDVSPIRESFAISATNALKMQAWETLPPGDG